MASAWPRPQEGAGKGPQPAPRGSPVPLGDGPRALGAASVGGKAGAAPLVFVNTAGRPSGAVAKGPSVNPRPAFLPPRRARSEAAAGTWRAAVSAPRRRAPVRRRWSGSG